MAAKSLIITEPGRYGTRMLKAGDKITLSGPKARLFERMGWAEERKRARRPQLDHDDSGKEGGSIAAEPPSLTGKNKAQLLKIAKVEGATVDDDATNAEIKAAIEAKRR